MSRVLIITRRDSYRTVAFIRACARLDLDLVLAADGPVTIVSPSHRGVVVDFSDPLRSLCELRREFARKPPCAVIGTDDQTIEFAALVAQDFNIPGNTLQAISSSRRKDLARACFAAANLLVPRYQSVGSDCPDALKRDLVRYPCVVKPASLSASRGVIRADNDVELDTALKRVRRILETEGRSGTDAIVLVEDFIAGIEVAIEAVIDGGRVLLLAVFDKPDPLQGPYFEETYYISPSRLSKDAQSMLQADLQRACEALGLTHGPVHAECRINNEGIWWLEIASRTIGGDCARIFPLAIGFSLEELILRHAIGDDLSRLPAVPGAGILMLPVPCGGVLRRIEGLSAARQVPYIEEIIIDVREGQILTPWPEGCSYPGFIFAKAPSAALAERALRYAHDCLHFVVAPHLPVALAGPPIAQDRSQSGVTATLPFALTSI
ncbi:MAG: ATP-grasp domain-containing protein [Gammaproteobacteria bacterium]|nr:ATP-grasp domain-containing protein [Gammaproteobacteria bacterium]